MLLYARLVLIDPVSFNEAAGADPADAPTLLLNLCACLLPASMRPRGQTPRMRIDRQYSVLFFPLQ